MDKQKKIILIIVLSVVILGSIAYLINRMLYQGKKDFIEPDNSQALGKNDFKPLDATINIEDSFINLVNGKSEKEIASGSASKIEVKVWGEPIKGDLTDDGVIDSAMIVTYSTGGSGTFYYIVATIHNFESKRTDGTNGILLGDRVAIQNVTITGRDIAVNYATRKKDQSMVIPPSINVTRHFRVEDLKLKETTAEEATKEQNCLISGGGIKDSLCCNSTSDFPNSCSIGACGCSPGNSHQVKTCDCGSNKCFDGKDCVDVQK